MTQSKINSASMVNANPLSIAEFVMQSSGTVNPNNFTFEKNTITITLKKKYVLLV
tara:strand:+ start:8479 stop:8643 length:165 start_codon:yes stop_codon:yes gene_type:complete